MPIKLQHALGKADRAKSRFAILAAAVGLSLTALTAIFLTSLPRLGSSPVEAAATLVADAVRGVPQPTTSAAPSSKPRQVAEASQPASQLQPAAPAPVTPSPSTEPTSKKLPERTAAAVDPRSINAPPTSVPRPAVIAGAPPAAPPSAAPAPVGAAPLPPPPAFEALDPAKGVAPIAQMLQSLEERLAALNVAAEAERQDAAKRAIERRELDQRDIERREAERKFAEQQRLAALSTPGAPGSAARSGASPPPKSTACLSAVEAATTTLLISFDTGSTVVSPVQVEQLKRFGGMLKSCPDAKLEVAGHTDAKGVAESNFSLSWRRAEAVIEVFRSVGVDTGRFTAVGYGTRRPLSITVEQQNPIDRRVEMTLR